MAKLKDFQDDNNNTLFSVLIFNFWERIAQFVSGLIGLCLFSIFVIVSIPVYLYRWLLVNIFVENCLEKGKGIAKPVSPLGNIFATEFLRNFPPRNAIVSNFVVAGNRFEHNEIRDLVQSRWIHAKEEGEERKKYPELQQYIDYWMGFMFWRQDNSFSLDNHLTFHRIPDTSEKNVGKEEGDATSEKYICSLVESLLNKPFAPGRSPWEIHVVENYKNSRLLEVDTEEMTAFVLRFHHSLADGFSLLYAVIEGLFGLSIADISLATAQESPSLEDKQQESPLMSFLKFPWRLMYDMGAISGKALKRQRTPWHVSDRKKKWKQIYGRSDLIPIQKMKDIKNMFGVSFTGTLLSCLSAGVQKSLEASGQADVENMMSLSPLPLPGHPKRFRNHVTAAVFDMPTSSKLNSLERLLECERRLAHAKQSTLPKFGVLYSKLVGSHLAPVVRKLMYNDLIPMGLSNFPGPGKEIFWNGRKGLAADFVAGAVTGVAGVGFMVLSYNGHIRIAVSAENAIMEHEDVSQLISFVCEEIDKLHALASPSLTKKLHD